MFLKRLIQFLATFFEGVKGKGSLWEKRKARKVDANVGQHSDKREKISPISNAAFKEKNAVPPIHWAQKNPSTPPAHWLEKTSHIPPESWKGTGQHRAPVPSPNPQRHSVSPKKNMLDGFPSLPNPSRGVSLATQEGRSASWVQSLREKMTFLPFVHLFKKTTFQRLRAKWSVVLGRKQETPFIHPVALDQKVAKEVGKEKGKVFAEQVIPQKAETLVRENLMPHRPVEDVVKENRKKTEPIGSLKRVIEIKAGNRNFPELKYIVPENSHESSAQSDDQEKIDKIKVSPREDPLSRRSIEQPQHLDRHFESTESFAKGDSPLGISAQPDDQEKIGRRPGLPTGHPLTRRTTEQPPPLAPPPEPMETFAKADSPPETAAQPDDQEKIGRIPGPSNEQPLLSRPIEQPQFLDNFFDTTESIPTTGPPFDEGVEAKFTNGERNGNLGFPSFPSNAPINPSAQLREADSFQRTSQRNGKRWGGALGEKWSGIQKRSNFSHTEYDETEACTSHPWPGLPTDSPDQVGEHIMLLQREFKHMKDLEREQEGRFWKESRF